MKLAMQVCLGPGHIVLDGDPPPLPQRETAPQFSAHFYCGQREIFGPRGQTAAWIQIPLGTEVGLGLRDIVLDGDQLPLP